MASVDPTESTLLGPLFATREMRALYSDRAALGRMLEVEAALARAEAAAGVIPRAAVAPIAAACNPDQYDAVEIAGAAPASGNVAIPLVKALTAAVARRDREAARYVHWGATSQDIIDTAAVLTLRDALGLLDADLAGAVKGFVALARRHRGRAMAGRTWLQQALPTTFGLKAARWASMLGRIRIRLLDVRRQAGVLQFGGAAGTLASLGRKGPATARRLAGELDLELPDAPWHSERDRIAAVAAELGILIGAGGKIARDLSLLMQSEIAEAFEPSAPGRGGSSTMPHKRNPVACAQLLAAATLAPGLVAGALSAMVQEQERALGGWQAEWIALPQLLLLASGSAARLAELGKCIEIDAKRMRENLELTSGLMMGEAVQMALGDRLGRMHAHELLEAASRRAVAEKRHLMEVLADTPEIAEILPGDKLRALFDPLAYLGSAERFTDAAIAAAERALAAGRKPANTRSKRKR